MVPSQQQGIRPQNASGLTQGREALVIRIKQILLFQTTDLRVDARKEFSSDNHGFEIQKGLNAQEIFNRDEKVK